MASFEDNPRTISNIEEVDETAVGSLMSLNAIFRRKSREVLSKLGVDSDSKKETASSVSHLPGIEEEKAREKKPAPELPCIKEEEEKKKQASQEKGAAQEAIDNVAENASQTSGVGVALSIEADSGEKKVSRSIIEFFQGYYTVGSFALENSHTQDASL